MDSIIIDSCNHLLSCLNDPTPNDMFFSNCVKEKISNMYKRIDREYDDELHALEVSINYNDFKSVKKCVAKIMNIMKKDRNSLLQTLERMC